MDEKHKMAKIVVWGSSVPFTNDVLKPVLLPDVQGQYVVNHFRWLMDRQLLEIPAKNMAVKPLQMSGDRDGPALLGHLHRLPAFGIALGVLAWFLRRKYMYKSWRLTASSARSSGRRRGLFPLQPAGHDADQRDPTRSSN
jgi:hypothetical protein